MTSCSPSTRDAKGSAIGDTLLDVRIALTLFALLALFSTRVHAQAVTSRSLGVAPLLNACALASMLDEATLRGVEMVIVPGPDGRAVIHIVQASPELSTCIMTAMARITRGRWRHGEQVFHPLSDFDLPLDPMPPGPIDEVANAETSFAALRTDRRRLARLNELAAQRQGLALAMAPTLLARFSDRRAGALALCRVVVGDDAFSIISNSLRETERAWFAQITRGRCGYARFAVCTSDAECVLVYDASCCSDPRAVLQSEAAPPAPSCQSTVCGTSVRAVCRQGRCAVEVERQPAALTAEVQGEPTRSGEIEMRLRDELNRLMVARCFASELPAFSFSAEVHIARDGAVNMRGVQMPRVAPPNSDTCVSGILEGVHLDAGSEGVVTLRMRYTPPR